MNLFGTELGSSQIMALVGLVATLILWLFVLRGERSYARWFRAWEAEREARRDTQNGTSGNDDGPSHGGPWG